MMTTMPNPKRRTISDADVLKRSGLSASQLKKLTEAQRTELIEKYWPIMQSARDLVIVLPALQAVAVRGKAGAIDCPLCKGDKTLLYSCAKSNGHIHAKCSTKGCISFMQ